MNQTGHSAPRLTRERALAAVEGDMGLLRELVAIFAEDAPSMLDLLSQAIESGSAASVGDAAHALKGSVAVFGAEAATALAYALEREGRSGRVELAPELFLRLRAEIDAVLAELAAWVGTAA